MAKSVEQQMMTDDLMLSVFVAVEGAHAFSAFMPSTFTALKFGNNPGDAAKLRMGYIPAVAFNLLLGGTVSYFAGSKKPLVASILVSGAMTAMYEWNIKMSVHESMKDGQTDIASSSNVNQDEAVGGKIAGPFSGEGSEGSGGSIFGVIGGGNSPFNTEQVI